MAKRKGARKRTQVPKPSKSKSHKLYREQIDYNRTLFTASIIALLAIVFLLVAFNNSSQTNSTKTVVTGNIIQNPSLSSVVLPQGGSWLNIVGNGLLANVFKYIFGMPINNEMSGLIITIAVWLILLFTFGDIIATFSSFTPWVSWVIAFLLTIVGANIGFLSQIIVIMTGIFVGLGAAAVYVGLGAAFVAFLLVNLGVQGAKKWIMRRKAMMMVAKVRAGGEVTGGTIRGLGSIGKALEKVGQP